MRDEDKKRVYTESEVAVKETAILMLMKDAACPGTAPIVFETFVAHMLAEGWIYHNKRGGKEAADKWLTGAFSHAASALTDANKKLQVRLIHSIEEKK